VRGTYTLTGSYPARPKKKVITYDALDHPTATGTGSEVRKEILAPSGRIVRRTVIDDDTGYIAPTYDTLQGYSGPGDSPAYIKNVANGTITTFVSGPGGLSAIYTGTTPSYPIYNGHGDVVGNTDVNGTFTATPVTDEFGIGDVGPNRLGWLGRHERFTTGGTLDLIRMGVRLYDPSIGRFTSVDPVEGGSANDYDYANADPVNNYDLDGRACAFGARRGRSQCKGSSFAANPGRVARWFFRHTEISAGACLIRCGGMGTQGGTIYGQTGWGCCSMGMNIGITRRKYSGRSCDTVMGGASLGPAAAYGEMGVYRNGSGTQTASRGFGDGGGTWRPSADAAIGWAPGIGAGGAGVTNRDVLGQRSC
jgi:RHS repeat-associated protein